MRAPWWLSRDIISCDLALKFSSVVDRYLFGLKRKWRWISSLTIPETIFLKANFTFVTYSRVYLHRKTLPFEINVVLLKGSSQGHKRHLFLCPKLLNLVQFSGDPKISTKLFIPQKYLFFRTPPPPPKKKKINKISNHKILIPQKSDYQSRLPHLWAKLKAQNLIYYKQAIEAVKPTDIWKDDFIFAIIPQLIPNH